MDFDMQESRVPSIPSRSESRERGRQPTRTRPASYAPTSSPHLDPSPFSREQTSSRPGSKHSSLFPPSSKTSSSISRSPNRPLRNASPYPSPFVMQSSTTNPLSTHQDDNASGLHRQPSTRLETATTIRQPSFPQFRNSIVTKPSMSLITRPGIVHVQPSQPLTRSVNSPATPMSGSTMVGSPLSMHTVGGGSPTTRTREGRVSVITVGAVGSRSGSPSGSGTAGTRLSARASLLAGPGPAITPAVRPAGPRPMNGPLPQGNNSAIAARKEERELDMADERDRIFDMKVEQILGPREETKPRREKERESRKPALGMLDIKKMIDDMKESGDISRGREGSRSAKKPAKDKKQVTPMAGKELWQSMYSMSGETLGSGHGSGSGSGSALGVLPPGTPDRLMGVDSGYSTTSGLDGKVRVKYRGMEPRWKRWLCGCRGR